MGSGLCFHCHKEPYTKRSELCKKCQRENAQLKVMYGISVYEREHMYYYQKCRCAFCGRKLEGTFVIEHCHTSGRVRGLTCYSCNGLLARMDVGVFCFNSNITEQDYYDYLNRETGL